MTLLASTPEKSQLACAGLSFGALVALGLLGSLPSLAPNLPTSLPGLGLGLALSKPTGWGGAAILIALGLMALSNLLARWVFCGQEWETPS